MGNPGTNQTGGRCCVLKLLHLPLIKLDVPVVLGILIRGRRHSFQVDESVVASGSASLVPAAVVETLGSSR